MTRKIGYRQLAKLPPMILIICFASFLNPATEHKQQASGLQVPDGFTIERAVDPELLSYPMFASFDDTGRLFVFESTQTNSMGTAHMLKEPTYHVRLLEDTDGDGIFDKSGIFADSIPLPMGGSFHEGSLYVAESPNLVKYTDTDFDGKADKREVILTGWVLHSNAATLSGPFVGPDGWFYLPDARRGFDITTKEGKRLQGKGARIWRCKPDGTQLESMSGGGFDNAIEIAFMPTGETIGTMTYFVDPQGGYRDALMHWVEGGVYPKPQAVIQEDKLTLTGPLMPVMSKTARVAPSGLMRMKGSGWGKTYDGNLFSAEFNTGRVMRHEVKQEGASYSTVDTPFMTSSVADSHPTDVLQDADGSMLVVITGGWFIEGCPLSRVAKPDVPGGIYRIRKKGTSGVNDAWGKKLKWDLGSITELSARLKDRRPAVRDRAVNQLVVLGNRSIPALKERVTAAQDDESRLQSLFAISRIGTAEALTTLRGFLKSKNAAVRTASVRSLGLAKDKAAVEELMKLAENDVPQVSRQAATALGQIGDRRAVPALLRSAAKASDRFEEHAIIFSLIELGAQEPLVVALDKAPEKTRKAALVALDQMGQSALQKQHLPPFLESSSEELRAAGIWVAAHHPEWTDVVVDFLEKQLQKKETTGEELIAMRDLMITFCKNDALQRFVANQLERPSVTADQKMLFLSVIGKCDTRNLPDTWTKQLAALLKNGSPEVRSEVLGLIQARRVGSLNAELSDILNDVSVAPGVRVKALSAKLISDPSIAASDFDIAARFLDKGFDAPVRQATANLLGQSSLSDGQYARIAGVLEDADQFLLPALVEVFAKGKSEATGMILVKALSKTPDRLNNISEQDLIRTLSTYPASVQTASKPLLENLRRQNAERLEKLAVLEKELPEGDVLEGRKLFFGKAGCSACHAVGVDGGDFGPDLTNIGDIRSRSDILEAILYPSVSFAREHETVNVTTSGGTYMGIIKEQAADYIVVTPGPGAGIRVSRSEISSVEPHNISMMPPGLDELLNLKEMGDLMAFMEALPDGIKPIGTVKR